jgi:menaquinol-cytochrome c reductase iron-sulfur subunit
MCAGHGPLPPKTSRRGFLFKLGIALNALGGLLVGIPVIGFLAAPMRRLGGQSWIQLGAVASFPEGETRLAVFRNPVSVEWDGATAKIACWVRHVKGDQFQIFAVNCTHLGCPVRWFAQSKLFMCPCHGGAYYRDGGRASGPPERGLFEYPSKVEGGVLTIQTGELPTPGPNAALSGGKASCA